MSRLAKAIRLRLEERGWQNKHVALQFIKECGEQIPSETAITKFSKLVCDNPEGWTFFAQGSRPAALARALEVTPEWIARHVEAPLLILDPRLDPKAAEFLVAASNKPDARFECRMAEIEDLPTDAKALDLIVRRELPRIARALSGCWIVVSSSDALAASQDLRVTNCYWARRGRERGVWRLSELPELVAELPPPSEPLRLVDDDGTPMVPCKRLETFVTPWDCGDEDRQRRARITATAETQDRLATFRLEEAWPHLETAKSSLVLKSGNGDYWGRARSTITVPKGEVCFEALFELQETMVWVHERRVLCWGPELASVQAALSPWHEVKEPTSFAVWKKYCEERNPWRFQLQPDKELATMLREEAGIDISDTIPAWIRRCSPNVPAEQQARTNDDPALRKQVLEIAQREFRGAWTSLPLVLMAAADAPLVALGTGNDLHVAANLGAGRVLELKAKTWTTEQRAPFAHVAEGEWDGGDIHLWIKCCYDQMLEGSALPARERRRARARTNDPDDDD